jgi:hypothetical protein
VTFKNFQEHLIKRIDEMIYGRENYFFYTIDSMSAVIKWFKRMEVIGHESIIWYVESGVYSEFCCNAAS